MRKRLFVRSHFQADSSFAKWQSFPCGADAKT